MRLGVVWSLVKGPEVEKDGAVFTCPVCGHKVKRKDIHGPAFCPKCGTQFSWDPVLERYIIQTRVIDEK